MKEYIEVPLALFGTACCVVSYLMLDGRRRLAKVAEDAELSDARSREHFVSWKYLDSVSHRIVLDPGSGMLITLVLVGILGLVAVYYLALQPLILPVIVVEAYAVFTQMDSVEAMFYARFLRTAGAQNLGRDDFEWVSWADRSLKRGMVAFLALGAATLLLSLVTAQLVEVLNTTVEYYAHFLYGIGDALDPISRVLGVTAMVLVVAGTCLIPGIVIQISRKVHRKRAETDASQNP